MLEKLHKIDVRIVMFVLTISLFILGAGAPGAGGC